MPLVLHSIQSIIYWLLVVKGTCQFVIIVTIFFHYAYYQRNSNDQLVSFFTLLQWFPVAKHIYFKWLSILSPRPEYQWDLREFSLFTLGVSILKVSQCPIAFVLEKIGMSLLPLDDLSFPQLLVVSDGWPGVQTDVYWQYRGWKEVFPFGLHLDVVSSVRFLNWKEGR